MREIIMAPERLEYTFDPVIPAQGILFCHGKPTTFKTHLGLTMSACLVHGGTLFGRYPTKLSTVAYIQADTPYGIQRKRLCVADKILPLDYIHYYHTQTFNMLKMKHQDDFLGPIVDKEPDFVVWDTLRKISRAASNDDDVPSLIYGTAHELFPDATHMFIHHDKKTVVDQDKLDKSEEFRGSGAWLADSDTTIHLTKASEYQIIVEFTKVRTCGPQDPIRLTLDPKEMFLSARGNPEPLVQEWWRDHPNGTEDQLYQYLMASFACTSRSVARFAYEGDLDKCRQHQ